MTSDLECKTFIALSALFIPYFPLKNNPGPKTVHVAEFAIAHNSSPNQDAVNIRKINLISTFA